MRIHAVIRTHGRYPYSAIVNRPVYDWPNGKRFAFYIALNVEWFNFGEGVGSDFAAVSTPPHHRGYGWCDYGNRVGVWRLLDMFNELELPVSIVLNSAVYDFCEEILVGFRERGDEIIAHGRTNSERQGELPEHEERDLIAETTNRLREREGKAPMGWLSPWISQSWTTPDLLKEAGYRYMLDWHFDDQPIWFATRAGPILSVPYPTMEVNDSPAFMQRLASEEDFGRIVMDNFDEQLEQSAKQPLVSMVALHTFIVGQPFRLRQLRRAMQHIASHASDVWLTYPGAITAHIESLPAGTVPHVQHMRS